MVRNRFTVILVLRIIFLLGNMVLITVAVKQPLERQILFTLGGLCILLILQVIMLFEFLNRTNQNLLRFFMIIFDSDYSTHFQEKIKSSPYIELNKAFNKVINKYKDLSRDKELQYYYLNEVVKHIKVGIISVNKSGEIEIMNNPACELLQMVKCKSWDEVGKSNPGFSKEVDRINKKGNRIFKTDVRYGIKNLSVHVSTIKLEDEPYRLITIQDVQHEYEMGEAEATHKLIRTLTHEIMNSITPISSLTETISMLLEKEDGTRKDFSELTEMNVSDIWESVKSIHERTEGLDHFLHEYRKLSQLPKLPELEKIKVSLLFESIVRFMQGEFQKSNIQFEQEIKDREMEIIADYHLMEQVIINLIRNSMDASTEKENSFIRLHAEMDDGQPTIKVVDNGKGILPDIYEQIFVPFYSTRKEGSGIGLSFSRQIMQLHGGSISVQSIPGEETVFTLRF